MSFLKNYHDKTLKNLLINKFLYKNIKEIPKLQKVTIGFGCKTTELKNLAINLLALELITTKRGRLTTTKKSNINLKIRKGQPVGCKVVLQKKDMFKFLEKTNIEIFPKLKNLKKTVFNRSLKKNSYSYFLNDTFSFSELEENYQLFNNFLTKLNITITIKSYKKTELFFVMKTLQFPFI